VVVIDSRILIIDHFQSINHVIIWNHYYVLSIGGGTPRWAAAREKLLLARGAKGSKGAWFIILFNGKLELLDQEVSDWVRWSVTISDFRSTNDEDPFAELSNDDSLRREFCLSLKSGFVCLQLIHMYNMILDIFYMDFWSGIDWFWYPIAQIQ